MDKNQFLLVYNSLMRLVIIPTKTCFVCRQEKKEIKEIHNCFDRLYGTIACDECCSEEIAKIVEAKWINEEKNVYLLSDDDFFTKIFSKNMFKIARSNGDIEEWMIENICRNIIFDDGDVKVNMYDGSFQFSKYVGIFELLCMNDNFLEIILQNQTTLNNWLVFENEEEKEHFTELAKWNKKFSDKAIELMILKYENPYNFSDRILNDIFTNVWNKCWIYSEKIFE